MTREAFLARYGTYYPGAFYGDAHPSGAQVRLYVGSHLETHLGRVLFPPGEAFGVLFARLTIVGGFAFAGQLHDFKNRNAQWAAGGWLLKPTTYEGHSPVIYDLDGRLWQNGLDEYVGAQGYRQIGPRTAADPGGQRIPADATTLLLDAELAAYSTIGPDLVIGQGHPDAAKDHCWIWERSTGKHRLLIDRPCWFIRATVIGDDVALYIPVVNEGAWIVICPMAALLELPASYMPGAPLPEPIGPRTPPRVADGRHYDLLPFYRGDPATFPRSGPTHPIHQVLGPQPGIMHTVKFGIDLPAPYVPGEAYETDAFDEEWIYKLEDASAVPDSLSDPRWFPRRMPIGEASAFETGEHTRIFRNRGTCTTIRTEPVRRRMWLHAVYDDFYWGPDLGHRATIAVVYDPTAGIHGPTRSIELGYYAYGAGAVRWESYPSDKVYADGGAAVFRPADRWVQNDFYLLGGPALQPKLTGCVPQVVPHAPPWIPPTQEDEMIAYGTPAPGFLPGDEKDNGNGTISVKKPNGAWLCVTPDGHVEERPSPGGPWESFKRSKTGSALVAERGDRVYVLPRADY